MGFFLLAISQLRIPGEKEEEGIELTMLMFQGGERVRSRLGGRSRGANEKRRGRNKNVEVVGKPPPNPNVMVTVLSMEAHISGGGQSGHGVFETYPAGQLEYKLPLMRIPIRGNLLRCSASLVG